MPRKSKIDKDENIIIQLSNTMNRYAFLAMTI